MGREFDGVAYDKLREMQEARRARRPELVSGGMNLTRGAEAAGVSKRTGKVRGNGRGGPSGRDERALVDRYRGDMEEPKEMDGHHLSRDEGTAVAEGLSDRPRKTLGLMKPSGLSVKPIDESKDAALLADVASTARIRQLKMQPSPLYRIQ